MPRKKNKTDGQRLREKTALGSSAFYKSARISVLYLFFGFLWIILTDLIANRSAETPFIALSITKGLVYVLVTAAIIFTLLFSDLKKLFKLEDNLKESNESLKKANAMLTKEEKILLAAQRLAHIGSFECNLSTGKNTCTQETMNILGILPEDTQGKLIDFFKNAHKEDRDIIAKSIKKYIDEKKSGRFQCRFIKADGSLRYTIIRFEIAEDNGQLILSGTIQDITESVNAMETLKESERSKAVLLSHLPGVAYSCRYDRDWTMSFLSAGFYDLTGYQPEDFLNNAKYSYNDIILPEYRENVWKESVDFLSAGKTYKYEYQIITASGDRKWVLDMGQAVYDEDMKIQGLEGILIDNTETKNHIEEIRYINNHDYLTGLYNRRYFESVIEEKLDESWLPVSIIVADINGIKLINDAFGYHEGDKLIRLTALKISENCRKDDIVCRLGGDDFMVILPRTTKEQSAEIVAAIRTACQEYNNSLSDTTFSINLSLGYGAMESPDSDINQVLKDAEASMTKQKLLTKRSHHSAVLSSIMATMYARSFETEEHCRRIARISEIIGCRMGLSQSCLDELQLFSMLHDIGKIGVSDSILNKPGSLTEEERKIMQRHPEIGYKIAMSSLEFSSIADYILCHHERWDGKGYPNGLKGEEIPLLSRILAVSDAYDAMTEDRVYRKAIPHEEAVKEIINNSGTQFDPYVVSMFLQERDIYLKISDK
ncbi:MAG: diguanylate cyclase [Papillibacter sp.]|nr:diguanylate cyclase [Papillibacter sp.]